MGDLSAIVKAYDIRGLVPEQLDADVARALGAAFAHVTAARAVVIGRDMRASSQPLSRAFAAGVTATGADVIDIGLASTDEVYFASGWLDLPAAQFTASHNPAQYNGIKLCRPGASPVGQDTGLAQVRTRAQQMLDSGELPLADAPGAVSRRDVLPDYAAYLHALVDLSGGRPLTVVVDAGNGMAGHTAPAVLDRDPLRIVPLYFELDGSFPHHEANPLDPANLVDLQAAVREHGADAGLAFDGDADRCFVIDERGEPVSPSAVTALVAVRELTREPGATVLYNLISSHAVPEIITEHGGVPVRTRVGHSFIKAEMARTGAIFGGEHSAHYYFRDFWRADTGMLAGLHVLAALGSQQAPLSELAEQYARYAQSGEINTEVTDQQAATAEVLAHFADHPGVGTDDLDGLTVSGPDWWFNLRPSNTEPLLRLNVEAPDAARVQALRDEVLDLVRGPAPAGTADSGA